MKMPFCLAFSAIAILSPFSASPAFPLAIGSTGEVEDLREIEKDLVRTIDAAKRAFVFLEGGSGFLISRDGYVLTNAHVVADRVQEGKRDFTVQLTGGKTFRADLQGRDPEGDVALLKLRKEPDVVPLELGDSDALHVGQRVIALGDPFLIGSASIFLEKPPPDYEPSASVGIISALHRYSDTYTDAIQVDVAVNRGNSGGPLLTLDGKVVGINGKIETRFDVGINTGVGYAIPSRQVMRFLEPLKAARGGIVRHGVIFGLDLADRSDGKGGLPVNKVEGGSSAELAGFLKGDLIQAIDGLPVPSEMRYRGILGTYPAGHEIVVKLLRAGAPLELRAPLVEPGPLPYLGLKTETEAGTTGGARVVEVVPSSPAERAGLQAKDIIFLFDGKKVMTSAELELYLQSRSAGDTVEVTLVRNGKPLEIKVGIGGRSKEF